MLKTPEAGWRYTKMQLQGESNNGSGAQQVLFFGLLLAKEPGNIYYCRPFFAGCASL
jgi:hypothetical protein